MKKKRWLAVVGCLLAVVLMSAGCSTKQVEEEPKPEPQTVKIAALSGPTGMGMAEMIAEGVELGEQVEPEWTIATAPDQVTAGIINGDYQIAAVPTNLAATLYNKTEGKVILGAVNTLGTLSIVADKSENINSMADLKGKTIYATGQGSTPEYVLNYLLDKNGLIPGTDVTIEWFGEHSEAAAKLASGEGSIAMLPQPFATATLAKNENLKVAVDMTDAWEKATDGTKLEMGCVVVNKEWAEKNPTIVKKFMEAYKTSVETINVADERAANDVVEAKIMDNQQMAQKAIPNCSIVFITPSDAKEDLQKYFDVLASFEPKSVGGKVPGEDFYGLTY
ncbi:ABC transporter substrate-binding protein [Eubacterium callanderi]|uniref:ABC transporter substrate-binding protein n=1 Tax=Eubacterium callanderi TaxID=53442 RepID=UPI00267215AF|nr:ABC transporter substrate-binding protein [Eubacterium callanderi]